MGRALAAWGRKITGRKKNERIKKKEAKDRGRVRAPKLRHFNLPVARGKEILIDSSFPRGIPHGTRVVEDGVERDFSTEDIWSMHMCVLPGDWCSDSVPNRFFPFPFFFFFFFHCFLYYCSCSYVFPVCALLFSRLSISRRPDSSARV